MYLTSKNAKWKTCLIVYYDLEFSGDIRNNFGRECSVHQIAAKSKRNQFFCNVNPYLTKTNVARPIDAKYPMMSKEAFFKSNAVSFPEAYSRFINFLYKLLLKRNKKWVLLVSHNGFRSDKIVLEHEIAYHRLRKPPVMFFDSLLFIRDTFAGLESYSLENLYRTMFNKALPEAHNAAADTYALEKVVKAIKRPFHGTLYPFFSLPWRNVAGIGFVGEQLLLNAGVTDVTMLYNLTAGAPSATVRILNTCGVKNYDAMVHNLLEWYKLCHGLLLQNNHGRVFRQLDGRHNLKSTVSPLAPIHGHATVRRVQR